MWMMTWQALFARPCTEVLHAVASDAGYADHVMMALKLPAAMRGAAPALAQSAAGAFRMVQSLGDYSDMVNRVTTLMGGGQVGFKSAAAADTAATAFDELPFDIAFADLSWEFTLFGDVDVSVSAESLGLPDIPADLAGPLKVAWVADVAVTLQGFHTYGTTFAYAVVAAAVLDLDAAAGAVEVHLAGKTTIPAPCQAGVAMAGHVRVSVAYLTLDTPATGVYNCKKGASPAYRVEAFVGELMIGGGVGFVIRDAVVRVEAEHSANEWQGFVGAWVANISGVGEVAAGAAAAAGMPGLDMTVNFTAMLRGTGDATGIDSNTDTNTNANTGAGLFESIMEGAGDFAIGNDDFEVRGSVHFEYPCTSGSVHATVGRCGLTVSNPELKARLVSALETKI
jgi:hypothetical protein